MKRDGRTVQISDQIDHRHLKHVGIWYSCKYIMLKNIGLRTFGIHPKPCEEKITEHQRIIFYVIHEFEG